MNTSKKILLIGLILLLVPALFANEITAVWTRLYNNSVSVDQKLAIMANIVEQHDREMIPVLESALNAELINHQNIADSTVRVKTYQLMDMILRELANLKASGAAADVYGVSIEVQDPFLQAEAIRTLGKIGAVPYAEEIAFRLRNINLGITPFTAKEEIETIVSASLETLELLRQEVGFSPVFFTSIGRYSAPVIKRAERAMINMVEDPTDLLQDILTYESDYNVKYQVLLVEDRSQAPEERKAFLAKEALDQGLKFDTSDRREQVFLSQMRTKAAEMLKSYATEDPEAYLLLDQMVRKSFSITETLTALEALGAAQNDESAKYLADFLSELNGKRAEGYTFSNEKVVRGTINALGNTGSPVGRPALIEVEFSNWSGDTRRLAKSALEKLN